MLNDEERKVEQINYIVLTWACKEKKTLPVSCKYISVIILQEKVINNYAGFSIKDVLIGC